MSRQVSCTATVGRGSERHNHDIKYRMALDHTHTADDPSAVIELLPYRPYKEQINELMKPYIDEYNERQQARYQAAWERYKAGEIKTKPRKANFKPMGYDYYEDHKDDTFYNQKTERNEPLPIWRSLIFGLGDKADRENGTITKEEAVSVMTGMVERWPELFPDFKLLGATIHLDEEGFYHAHFDYKPLYSMDCGQGLTAGIGQEGALEHMGFEPEQSLINERDKAPIRFNAFRNRLYLETEKELHKHDLRLVYGVSKHKEPEKDSSTNQDLGDWQEIRDRANDIQQMKNAALDIISDPEVSPEGFEKFAKAVSNLERTFDEVEHCEKQAFRKNRIVPFHLFDQMKTFKDELKAVLGHFYKQIEHLREQVGIWRDKFTREHDRAEELEEKIYRKDAEIGRWKEENTALKHKINRHDNATKENELRRKFMQQYKIEGVPMEQKFQKFQEQQQGLFR